MSGIRPRLLVTVVGFLATSLNRHRIVAALAVFFCTTLNDAAFAEPFLPGDFVTYSQDSWGATPGPGNAAQLLLDSFDFVYLGGGVEVGVPGLAGFSMVWTSGATAQNYLPASGTPGPLNADLLDPMSSASGAFGGSVLALQLNVDFNDAGALTGSSGILFGDLVLADLGPFALYNGLTVRQYLAEVNSILGSDPTAITHDDLHFLTQELTAAFEGGTPSAFAQGHLGGAVTVPEPSTLSQLGIGLAALAALCFKRVGRSAPNR